MQKTTKVELTEAWWKKNKAKTLVDKGNLGKALKAYETAAKQIPSAKGGDRFRRLFEALAACDAMLAAADKTAKACLPKLHDDTQHVLQKTFPTEVKDTRKALEKAVDRIHANISSMSLKQVLADKPLRDEFYAMLKARFEENSLEFLKECPKKDADVVKRFILNSAPQQVNLSSNTIKTFEKALQEGTLDQAPWEDARKECVNSLLYHLQDFGTYLRERAEKG